MGKSNGKSVPITPVGPNAPKIAICVPSADDWMADTAVTVSAIMHFCGLTGLPVALMNNKRTVISAARNDLVAQALTIAGGADYIFFLDSDMIVPYNTIHRLLAHDKDIACATYNRRIAPYSILGYLDGPPQEITGGLHKATFMPGGVMLIKADVFARMEYPYFFETYTWAAASPQSGFIKMLADWSFVDLPLEVRSLLASAPAIQSWLELDQAARIASLDPKSRLISEDYNFCRKARKAGFEIWCDFDLTFECAHVGTHRVTCESPDSASRGIPTTGPIITEPTFNGEPMGAPNSGGL